MALRRRKPWEGHLQPPCYRRKSVKRLQPRTTVTLIQRFQRATPRPRRRGQPPPAQRPRNTYPRSKHVPKVDHLLYRAAFPAFENNDAAVVDGQDNALDFTQTVKRPREPVATPAGTCGPNPYPVPVPGSKKSKVALKPRVPPDDRRRKDSL
ncbi:unnamed protein product [Ixodes persulcatus]